MGCGFLQFHFPTLSKIAQGDIKIGSSKKKIIMMVVSFDLIPVGEIAIQKLMNKMIKKNS